MDGQIHDRINQHIGNYELKSFLGRGGFADVYLGQHIFLNTEAAIKVLRTQLRDKDLASFLQEARTIAHLTHPNIIHVLDFGTYEEVPFLVMEYAPHGNLRDHHPKGTLVELADVVSYVKQIAAGLQYAHDAKHVHCDVKPENMLVGREQQILLSDFGISIVTQNTQSQSTLESIQGTAAYMAPEQIDGKPKAASDQYALGIITYEWLCGERPFQGSFLELCNKHLTQPAPPLRSKNPDISPEIEYVVMTTLQKDPAQRFHSVRAFANALEQSYHTTQQRLLTSEPDAPVIFAGLDTSLIPTQPAPAGDKFSQRTPRQPVLTRRKLLIAGTSAALIAAAGGGIWYANRTSYAAQSTTLHVYQHKGAVESVAWYGENVASGSQDETVQVWNAQSGVLITAFQHDTYVTSLGWSPDGTSIASSDSDGYVDVWPVNSKLKTAKASHVYVGARSTAFSSSNISVAWSPNAGSNLIASTSGDSTVQIWNATNGQSIKSFTGHTGLYSLGVNAIAWSPISASNLIASAGYDGKLLIWEADTLKTVQTYTQQSARFNSLCWSPDGTSLACACSDNTVVILHLSDVNAGRLEPFLSIYTGHTDRVLSVAWSPDGQFIASGGEDAAVHIWSPTRTAQAAYVYLGHNKQVNSVAWAADSHRIASGSNDETVKVWEAV